MECLANVATAIGKPDLHQIILNLVAIKEDEEEKQEESVSKGGEKEKQEELTKDEKNQVNTASLKKEWTAFKQEGNQLYKQERWSEAMNCYSQAIHLTQGEAVLYANRAQCELRLSKFDIAREDIEDAIQLDPKNVKYFRVLSEILLGLKLHKESLEACLQGLQINPRDEILNIRERDCRALIVSDETDKNPAFGKSILEASLEEKKQQFAKLESRIKNLPLMSEDIEECPNLDSFLKRAKLSQSIAEAHQYEHGTKSTTQGCNEKAFAIFEAAAKKGSAEGLYNVARFYSEGKGGLPRDFPKTVEMCRKAASQKAYIRFKEQILPNVGVAEAEAFLGNCYRDGRGVDQCTTKAFEWYLKAAHHDCPTAQNNLGLALLNGDGCRKNETSARSWFQKAAEHGLAEAHYNYAMVLEEGLGGPIDVKKAAELLKLSAKEGTPGALNRLQKLTMSGALGGTTMEKTKDNLKKAAKKGDPASVLLLGQNYLNGTGGFDKDLRQAERYLKEASKAGLADAHLPLGKLLLELKKNEEAVEFIKLAAEKGSVDGQLELGMLYAYGHGCDRDEGKARRWLNRAFQQGLSFQLHSHDGEEKSSDVWVEKEIGYGKEVLDNEIQQKFKSDGLSLQERKRRFITSKVDPNNPVTSSFLEFLDASFPAGGRPPPTPNVRSMKGITTKCMDVLMSRARNGSPTAQSFFKACQIVEEAIDLLSRRKINEAFKLYRLSFREWDLPIIEFSDFYSDCVEAAKKSLDRNTQDADALYVLVRTGTVRSNEEKLRMVKRCVELDPSVPDFHHLLACILGFVGDHNNGLRAVDRALELLPDQTDWLYDRATFIRLKETEKQGADDAEAYLKFISSNPRDHRKFPEACYCLAQIYLLSGDHTQAKSYYQKGLDAEDPQVRLPCYEPVDYDFPPKMMIQRMFKAMEGIHLSMEINFKIQNNINKFLSLPKV